MSRLCGAVNHTPTEGRRHDKWKAEESNERTGGRGGEGHLLAVAKEGKEEGKGLGKEHLTQIPAVGGDREMSPSLSPSLEIPWLVNWMTL